MDGVYVDPAADNTAKVYRIEVSGVDELPAAAREAIATTGAIDIVRSPGVFIVAPLDGAAALKLRSSLETIGHTYTEMETKLSKIVE